MTPLPEDLRAQYHEVWEYLRHHNNLIWAMPSVAAAIASGVIIGAFRFVNDLIAREGILGLGATLTFILYIAVVKNRYFYNIEEKTLREIETKMELKHLQGKTLREDPQDPNVYWYWKKANWIQSVHAHESFVVGMLILFGILVMLMIVTAFSVNTVPTSLVQNLTKGI
jgi:hypothetical protein